MSLAGTGAVAIWHDIAPEGRAEFYAWHGRQHMPERAAIPGFIRGRRYVAHLRCWLGTTIATEHHAALLSLRQSVLRPLADHAGLELRNGNHHLHHEPATIGGTLL